MTDCTLMSLGCHDRLQRCSSQSQSPSKASVASMTCVFMKTANRRLHAARDHQLFLIWGHCELLIRGLIVLNLSSNSDHLVSIVLMDTCNQNFTGLEVLLELGFQSANQSASQGPRLQSSRSCDSRTSKNRHVGMVTHATHPIQHTCNARRRTHHLGRLLMQLS